MGSLEAIRKKKLIVAFRKKAIKEFDGGNHNGHRKGMISWRRPDFGANLNVGSDDGGGLEVDEDEA
jgi:hypothetical protein